VKYHVRKCSHLTVLRSRYQAPPPEDRQAKVLEDRQAKVLQDLAWLQLLPMPDAGRVRDTSLTGEAHLEN
jgi:hypothetical protein